MLIPEPTKYLPEYCQAVVKDAEEGKSIARFCANINISKSTYYNWIRMFPDFKYAAELAETHRTAFFEDKGINNLENKEFNAGLYKSIMLNLADWRMTDKDSNLNLGNKDGQPLKVETTLSPASKRLLAARGVSVADE